MNDMQVNLNKSYNYICLDLETTWLDKEKDHIIQIGIIKIDHAGKVIDTFCSYIKPWEDFLNLSDTVSHLTDIKKEDLINAPSLSAVSSDIESFFDDNVVIIGHNIWFDLGFLEKSIPSLRRSHSIDTFDIIWSSIPYLKSYALENIHTHLSTEEGYRTIYDNAKKIVLGNREKSHDALYDSMICYCIIQWRIQYLVKIFIQFPYVAHLYSKVDEWNNYIEIINNHKDKESEIMSMPHIERPSNKKSKSLENDKKINPLFLGQGWKISMKWLHIQELINELPMPSIIAVSHPSKIDIIKNACPWYRFNYLKEDQIIDFALYEQRTQKKSLSMSEWLFCILYVSHALLWYSIIQAVITEHKHILSYITKKESNKNYENHILCTHGWWYAYRDQHSDRSEQLSKYTICMRDIDRRYITYNDYSSKYFNPQALLFHREELLYHETNDVIVKKESSNELNKSIYNDMLMFLGVFYIECESIYREKKKHKRESICSNNENYTRSIWLWDNIYNWWKNNISKKHVWSYLDKMMEKMNRLLYQESIIQYSESTGKGSYYTLTPVHKYIDFSEYNDLFAKHIYCFLSTNRPEYTTIKEGIRHKDISIQSLQSISDIEKNIINSSWKNVFIISHNSEKTKQIFASIRQKDYMKNREILAEYITGWIQKNVAKWWAKDGKLLVMIGWYHYLLNIRSANIKTENIIICHIPKQREWFIYNDILRYAP